MVLPTENLYGVQTFQLTNLEPPNKVATVIRNGKILVGNDSDFAASMKKNTTSISRNWLDSGLGHFLRVRFAGTINRESKDKDREKEPLKDRHKVIAVFLAARRFGKYQAIYQKVDGLWSDGILRNSF